MGHFSDHGQYVHCFAATAVIGVGAYVAYKLITGEGCCGGPKKCRFNTTVKVDEKKVVDVAAIEDLGDKAVFCRCWKSKKFPYCDGSHESYNKQTGDNLGPLIVKKKDA